MTKGGFFAAGIGLFAGLLVIAFAGFVAFLLFSAWAVIASLIAAVPLLYLDAKRDGEVTQENSGLILLLPVAFLIAGAAAFALDLVFKTYISLPAMIDALELTHFEHARRERIITSTLDYYRFVLGPTPSTWLRFAGYQAMMVLVFAAVLYKITSLVEPEPQIDPPEPVPPVKRYLQLVVPSAMAVGTVTLTLFPLTTWAMLALLSKLNR